MTPLAALILNFLMRCGPHTIDGLRAQPEFCAHGEHVDRTVRRIYMAGFLSREPHPVRAGQIVYGYANECRWTAEQEIRLGLALQQQPEPVAA